MKDRIFDWRTVFRRLASGALPFLLAVFLYERWFGEWSLGVMMVMLAALLPFVAIGWLGYQHWKHRENKANHG